MEAASRQTHLGVRETNGARCDWPIERSVHWAVSCVINRCLGGQAEQPLCARAWERQWVLFIELMGLFFDEGPTHCEEIYARWLALSR
jgi:hypothetical protein